MSSYNKLAAEFSEFNQNNPLIWELLVKFAFEAKKAGTTKLSISLLIERIRWEIEVVTRNTDGYKINNNHRAFYARKLMETYPELAGMFRTRAQKV